MRLLRLTLYFFLFLHPFLNFGQVEVNGFTVFCRQNEAKSLAISRDTLFIGTGNGVYTRDLSGKLLGQYPLIDEKTFTVELLDVDRDNKVWIQSYKGVTKKLVSGKWIDVEERFRGFDYFDFDGRGNMYFLKTGKQLILSSFENDVLKSDTIITSENYFSDGILGIRKHKDGTVWVVGNGWIFYKNKGKWERVHDISITSFYEHPSTGDFWFGGKRKLYKWDGNKWDKTEGFLPEHTITGIFSDNEGDIWLTTQSETIRWNLLKEDITMHKPGGFTHSIVKDNSGKIWLGGGYTDLYSLHGRNLRKYKDAELLEGEYGHDPIYFKDSKNRIWLSNDILKDANLFENSKWRKIKLTSQLKIVGGLIGIEESIGGKVFMFSPHSGVNYLKGNNFFIDPYFDNRKSPNFDELVLDNYLPKTFSSASGKVYVITQKGFSYWDDKIWNEIPYKHNKYLPDDFTVDSKEAILFLNDYKLFKAPVVNNKIDTTFLLHDKFVTRVIEDKERKLWIHTMSNGVFYFENNEWIKFNIEEKGKFYRIEDMVEDTLGRMWFVLNNAQILVMLHGESFYFYPVDLGEYSSKSLKKWGKDGVAFMTRQGCLVTKEVPKD